MAELHQGAPLSAAQIGVLVEEVEDGREDARVAKALRIIAAAVDFRAHAAAHQAILKLQPQLVKAIADRGAATAARADACLVLKQLADCDKGCRPQLLPGLPQALTSALRTTDARALHIAAMHAYLSSIRDIDASTRAASLEELQRLGGLSDLAACLRVRDDEVNETAARIWGWVCAVDRLKEAARDQGVIPDLVRLCADHPDSIYYIASVHSLAAAPALHIALREADAVGSLARVLAATQLEVVIICALIAVAHLCAGEHGSGAADGEALLAKYPINHAVYGALDSALHGDGWYGGLVWTPLTVVRAVSSLAKSARYAEAMVRDGVAAMLVEVLGDEPWRSQRELVVQACCALQNLACHAQLQARLHQAGVPAAAEALAGDKDVLVSDSAKAVLLMLDVLNDSAAQRANDKMLRQGSTRRRAADVSCTDDDAAAAAAGVAASASTLPASTTSYGGGDSGGGATAAAAFNVFLSHKRSDAKDYARALYNLLVLRGIATFLDFEFREELNDLEKIVAGCTNFIFILTDNVFDSKWCMRELESAVEAGVNIILVCKEGSRWRDEKGVKCCDFPPPHIIDALPGKVRSVFTRKALQHSDEYYQMFVELLLQRIADGDARRAAREAGGAAAAVGGTAGRGSWSTISSGAAPAAVVAATAASRGGSLSQQLLAASPQPQQSPRSSMTSVPPDATTATPSAAAGGVGSSIPYSIPSVTPFAAYHASPSPSALAGRASATAARQFAHTVQGAAFDAAAILELSHDVGALQSKIAQLAADGSVSPRASHYAAQQLVVGTVPAEIARLQADMAHLQQAVRGMEIDLAGLRSMVSQGFASLQTSLHGVLSAMTLNAAAAAAAAAAAQSQQSAPLASQAPTTAAASPAASSAAGARQEA